MIRSVLYFAFLWSSMMITSPIALFYLLLVKLNIGSFMEGFLQKGVSGWAKFIIWISGSKLTIDGLENIPDEKGLCFVANHQGAVDILVVLGTLPTTVGFIAKRQLIYYPFLNLWILAIRSTFIDRGNIKKAVKSIEAGVTNLKKGNSLLIFPEGTRSKGGPMADFKGGSIKLATRAEATIIPLTINGTWHVWEEHHSIRSAEIKFTIHPPISTKGLTQEEKKELPARLAAQIKTGLNSQ